MLLSDNGSIHPVGDLAAKQPDVSLGVGRQLKKKVSSGFARRTIMVPNEC